MLGLGSFELLNGLGIGKWTVQRVRLSIVSLEVFRLTCTKTWLRIPSAGLLSS